MKSFINLRPGGRLVLFTLIAGAAFTSLLLYTAWTYSLNYEREALDKESEIVFQRVTSSLVAAQQSIRDLTLLFRASESVAEDEFEIVAKSMLRQHEFLNVALYAPLVEKGLLPDFELRMRSAGYLSFKEKPVGNPVQTGRQRQENHLPVQFVEPFTVTHSIMLGMDLLSHPLIQEAVQESVGSGKVEFLFLRQGEMTFTGLAVVKAVYSGRYAPESSVQRKERFRGVIMLLLDAERLMGSEINPNFDATLFLDDAETGIDDGPEPIFRKEYHVANLDRITLAVLSASSLVFTTFSQEVTLQLVKNIHHDAFDFVPLIMAFLSGGLISLLGWFLSRGMVARNRLLTARNVEIKQEVKRQTTMLSLVLDTIPVRVFWKDGEGRYLGCNLLFVRDAGHDSAEDIIGKTDQEMPWRNAVESYRSNDAAVLATGRPKLNFEEQQTPPGRPHLWLKTSIIPLPGPNGGAIGVLGVYEDITEQKEAQEKSRRLMAELNFQKLALDEHAIVSVTDVKGNINYVNDKFVAISGFTREEMIGQNHRMVKSGEHSLEFYKNMWKTIAKGRPWHGEVKNQTKNGEHYWVRATIVPFLNEKGKPFKYVSIRTDITAMKDLEAGLMVAKDQAEAAAKAKSEFLANMSHEIRTPMNAVIGLSHLCLQTRLTARQKDYIRKVHNSATSLLRIINDILDFSKIEAGRLEMESIDFTLEEVLGNMAAMTSLKAQEKKLEFLLETAVDIPPSLVGDPLRLGQVLINLTNNAIKFTDEGEVVVVTQLVEKDDEWARLRFTVRDSGIGMTEEQRGKLFQAFSQADTSITRKHGGTGLGLTISQRLIHMMDGEIRAESEPGKGSRFIFDARFGISNRQFRKELVPAPDIRGKKVLAVDDNDSARNVISDYLTSFTFKVTLARDGREAMVLAQEADMAGEPFDLIVMDYMMPEVDGITAAAKIRNELGLSKPPKVIMATAYGEENVVKRAMEEAQVDGFLVKPINQSLLFEAAMEAFGHASDKRDKDGLSFESARDFKVALSGARILLVEDNDINQQVARELLEQAHITVLDAVNGKQAVDKVLSGMEIDGVLMDVQMPVMDGLAATREIRKDARFASLPILAMTANAMSGDRELCLDAGMQDHIAKPVDPANMFSTMVRWIKPANPKPVTVQSSSDSRRSESPPPKVPDIPGLDVSSGLARMGGNAKGYLDLLARFRVNQGNAANAIREALDDGQSDVAERLAHTLKGVSATIGAHALSEPAKSLEAAIKDNAGSEKVDEFLERAAGELEKVCRALEEHLPKSEQSDAEDVATNEDIEASIERRDSLMKQAYKQLSFFDAAAENSLEALLALPLSAEVREMLKEAEKKIAQYDFDGASQSLKQLAGELGLDVEGEDS